MARFRSFGRALTSRPPRYSTVLRRTGGLHCSTCGPKERTPRCSAPTGSSHASSPTASTLPGPSDRYRDVGIDAQYQFVTDLHRFSTQFNWIDEQQRLNGSFTTGMASNADDALRTFKGKATYYYAQKYGVTLQYFRARGSADDLLYNTGEAVTGSVSGSPNSSGVVAEIDWLPVRNLRLLLQYTAYREFNGARSNYDGEGRNAKDNNTLYFVLWLML